MYCDFAAPGMISNWPYRLQRRSWRRKVWQRLWSI